MGGLAFGLALALSVGAQAAPRGGVYTNVCVSPEDLDQGGDEVQFALLPAPRGTFAWCAGGCVRSVMNDIRLNGDRISFSVTEHYFSDRQPPENSSVIHHFSGRFKGGVLTLTSSDDPDFGRAVLHRKDWKPDRLSPKGAAAEQSEWPAPVRRCG
jgi:hypothetical protein